MAQSFDTLSAALSMQEAGSTPSLAQAVAQQINMGEYIQRLID